ncbi:MAG TPA: MFS transporter [Trebonia sp.]|nr:MFS transporter [Trebonia sp.]
MTESSTSGPAPSVPSDRPACEERKLSPFRILRDLPKFRSIWLSKSISSTGSGVGRIALVLMVAPSGATAVALVLAGTALPMLLGPLAGAVADRADQRRLLAATEAGQGVIYAALAITRPPLPVLLPLVILAALLQTSGAPAGKGAVRRIVPQESRPQANALLSLGLNLQVILGPALGGVLTGLSGVSVAFGVNAVSFAISALLLTRIGPLPVAGPRAATLMGDTMAGLRYARRNATVRGLTLGTLVFVTFAGIDNVALVFLVKGPLHGTSTGYGLVAATFGVGMIGASVALSVFAGRRPGAFWLIGGVITGGAGGVLSGLAPDIAAGCVGQVIGGIGNTADLVGTDTLIQQHVPQEMLGRAYGIVYGGGQLALTGSSVIAAPLVALAGARVAFVIAGAGALASLPVLLPLLRRDPEPGRWPAPSTGTAPSRQAVRQQSREPREPRPAWARTTGIRARRPWPRRKGKRR